MYRSKHFQGLFGDAAFFHRNPGVDATAGDRRILAGVLMHHITMVQSMTRVTLKGLVHPDHLQLIQRMDEDNPDEIEVKVNRSVQEIMMGKKIQGTKVWVLITQQTDGRWVGFFWYGIGNNAHHNHLLEWSGGVSSHVRYHLLC
jgi:hypothetical protein